MLSLFKNPTDNIRLKSPHSVNQFFQGLRNVERQALSFKF